MKTRHVPSDQWRSTLDALSRTYDGAVVSLEIVDQALGAQNEILDQPLRGISSDRSGVTIRVARPEGHLDHLVPHPCDVRIVETDDGAVMAVEIRESEERHALLHFRSPVRAELLDPSVE